MDMLVDNVSNLAYIKLEKKGNVAEVILNRKDRLNIMDDLFFREFEEAVNEADRDSNINVILIWSQGDTFSAGLDLAAATAIFQQDKTIYTDECKAMKNLELKKMIQRWQSSFSSLQRTPKPVICAIQGNCIGSGVDLITAADIRLATQEAMFSIDETKVAIVADLGTLQRISRIVGRGMAREMAFTSNKIGAQRALQCGLINQLFSTKAELLSEARSMASKIASYSPLVVQATKQIIQYSDEHTESEGLEHVALWNTSFLKSKDLREALVNFPKRRIPVFTSKL